MDDESQYTEKFRKWLEEINKSIDPNAKPGKFVINDAANDDWIRSARLAKKAEQGDKEAAKKLKELEETKLVYYDDDGNEHPVED